MKITRLEIKLEDQETIEIHLPNNKVISITADKEYEYPLNLIYDNGKDEEYGYELKNKLKEYILS